MYNTTDSVPRQDITTLLEEAVHQDEHFIAQQILPVYTSPKEIGRYPKFRIAKGELLKRESQKRNATGTYNESDESFEWDSYSTEEYGHEKRVDDKVKKEMKDFFDAEVITGKFCMRKVMMDYELEAADAIMDPDTFTAANGVQAYTETNINTMDVPQDIQAAQQALSDLGEDANTIVLSLRVWNRIKRSKLMQTFLYGFLNTTQGGANITPQVFGDAFMIPNVVIARKTYDAAPKGRTNIQPIWGNNYIFLGDVQGGDFMEGGAGRSIIWEADSEGGLFTTDQYREEKRRGDMIRVRSNRTIKIINPNAGYLIGTQWA